LSSYDEPQVSWKVIEAGTPVITSDGEKTGTVHRLVGDPEADVFTGLAVKVSILSGERLVESEQVEGIWPDRVHVSLTQTELEALPEYADAPVVRFEPEKPSFWARLFGRR
jgi:hypothetical protein